VFAEMAPDARAQDGVTRVLNKLIGERDYSAQEVMHHLLDLKLFKSSQNVVNVNVKPLFEQRVQIDLEASGRVVHFGRTSMEHYMERETAAENLSFAEILRDFTRQTTKDGDGKWPYRRRSRGKSSLKDLSLIFTRLSIAPVLGLLPGKDVVTSSIQGC